MFTGIITDLGEVTAIVPIAKGKRFTLRTGYDTGAIELGASIAHDGACMTVVARHEHAYEIEVSPESLDCTTLVDWQIGAKINLERPVVAGGEFGGHFVTGHVDAVATVKHMQAEGDFWRLAIHYPQSFGIYLAEKGSVAVNGVSLTVNQVNRAEGFFELMIIPHTLENTNLGQLTAGSKVNLEADLIARYLHAGRESR